MSENIHIIQRSRKRDKLLLIFGWIFSLIGILTFLFVPVIISLSLIVIGVLLQTLGKFFDWWHRGLIENRNFH